MTEHEIAKLLEAKRHHDNLRNAAYQAYSYLLNLRWKCDHKNVDGSSAIDRSHDILDVCSICCRGMTKGVGP